MTEFDTFRGVIPSSYCDQMGHVNTQYYAVIFEQSTALLFHEFEAGRQVTETLGWADVIHRTEFKGELLSGARVGVRSSVLAVGRTSVSYLHQLYDLDGMRLVAVQEGKTVRFNLAARRATQLSEEFRRRATAAISPRHNTVQRRGRTHVG